MFAMQEINLYRLMAFYVRNWLLIVSLTLIGLLGGLVYNTYIQAPLYKSDATLLFINPSSSTSTQDTTTINNYVQLFKSRRVLEPVMNDQHIDMTFDQFIGSVNATNEKGTEVIQLSVSTKSPEISRNFLREAVVSFKQQAKNLYGKDSLSVVDNASNAQPPYNVHKAQQLVIATTAGFIVSLIVLFFVYDIKGDFTATNIKKRNANKPSSVSDKKSSSAGKTNKKTKPTTGKKKAITKTIGVAKKPATKKTTVKKPIAK